MDRSTGSVYFFDPGRRQSVRPEKRRERYERILDAAREQFRTYGYRKTSLEEIATAAGVGKATLYHYVEGKDQLLGDVLQRHYTQYVDRLRTELAEESSAPGKLRRYALVLMDQHRRVSEGLVVPRNSEQENFPFIVKHLHRFAAVEMEILADVLRAGVESGTFRPVKERVVATLLFASFKGMIAHACQTRADHEEIIEQFLSVLLNGLLAAPAGR